MAIPCGLNKKIKNKHMKYISTFLLLSVLIFSSTSCNRNRLKNSEKTLVNEILVQENEKTEAEKIALEQRLLESKNNGSANLRMKEIRSVDPQNPPARLDILGTVNNIREFKLSDFGSSIRYVKLQTPPDTILLYDPFFYRDDLISLIRSDGEQIVFQGFYGSSRFSMDGRLIETIWKNYGGITGTGIMLNEFVGIIPGNPVSLSNGNIYLPFFDGPSKQNQIRKYEPDKSSLTVQSQSELPEIGTIKGQILHESNLYPSEGFDMIFGVGTDTWAGINGKWNAGKSGALLVTFNDNGDTLCTFTDYDRIKNFSSGGGYRNAVWLTSYLYNNELTILQAYCDTVFRLIPPNRLLPVFVIDFGDKKINHMDGLNPDFDLSEKLMLSSLYETEDYLFIRYTQNNDSPNNRKKNAVKFYNAFYDKKEGKLYHQSVDPSSPKALINDLDRGFPFWPDFISPQGEMMKLVSGKVLKDYVNSPDFKQSAVSASDKKRQIEMVAGLKNTDMIIMIVK